jgi:hypothetical protein
MTWTPCTVLWPRQLIDGSWAFGRLMRRVIDGETQYRRMDEVEEQELDDTLAW